MKRTAKTRKLGVAAILAALLGGPSFAPAAELFWGADGYGTAGAWDLTTVNWSDGAQPVTWSEGGDAVFRGAGGVVNSFVFGPTASSLRFDTPGYTLTEGWLQGGAGGLHVITHADATLSSTLNSGNFPDGDVFTKSGAGMLTVAGTNFFHQVRVDEGEYRATSTSAVFFSDITIAANARLTLAPTTSGNISIGGLAGAGIVQPNDAARTVTTTLYRLDDFTGSLRDNGSGRLAVSIFGSAEGAALLGENLHSGATTVRSQVVTLKAAGSIRNSEQINVNAGATLRLDDREARLPDRIGDTATVALRSGTLELLRLGTITPEQAGVLSVTGASRVVVSVPDGPWLTGFAFAGFQRAEQGTLAVSGSGRVTITGLANGAAGIVAPFVTVDGEWAVADAAGTLTAFTAYATDINAGAATDHVKLTSAILQPMQGSRTRASLRLHSTATTGNRSGLHLVGGTLRLTTGGILTSGSGPSSIEGGVVTAPGEIVVTNANNLIINSRLQPGAGGGLTKSGAGTLTLLGANTYAGVTTINEGTLAIANNLQLGNGSAILFAGGRLQALGDFSSAKNLVAVGGASATIDTNGHDVTFSGTTSGGVTKSGSGILTLTTGSVGSSVVDAGTLRLPNATSGFINLRGGTLDVQGTLNELSLFDAGTLSIAGPTAGSLRLDRLSPGFGAPLTIDFDLGSHAQDALTIAGPFGLSSIGADAVRFAFRDLGGLTTGVDYVLLTIEDFAPWLAADSFALAPELVAQGWQATFTTSGESVTVNFAAVPEPGPVALLALAGLTAILFAACRSLRPLSAGNRPPAA